MRLNPPTTSPPNRSLQHSTGLRVRAWPAFPQKNPALRPLAAFGSLWGRMATSTANPSLYQSKSLETTLKQTPTTLICRNQVKTLRGVGDGCLYRNVLRQSVTPTCRDIQEKTWKLAGLMARRVWLISHGRMGCRGTVAVVCAHLGRNNSIHQNNQAMFFIKCHVRITKPPSFLPSLSIFSYDV